MAYFLGTFDHNLDAKNRFTVPSKFRDAFKEGAVMVSSPEGCIEVHPEERYSAMAEQVLSRFAPFSPDRTEWERLLFADAHNATPDSVNRITLPAPLMADAGLKKAVKVVAKGSHFEIWSPERWESKRAELRVKNADMRARLAHPV